MWKDPIVEEVRAVRQQIAEECWYDPKRMVERQLEILKKWKRKVVTKQELVKGRRGVRRGSK